MLINHASGLRVPQQIEHEFASLLASASAASTRLHASGSINASGKGIELECRASLSFFDTCTRTFFGRTFVTDATPLQPSSASSDGSSSPTSSSSSSPSASSAHVLPTAGSACHGVPVYFRTPLVDASRCFAVVEIILVVTHGGVALREYAIGWTLVECFDRARVTDVAAVNVRAYDADRYVRSVGVVWCENEKSGFSEACA
jgi:hypothetical protein